MWQNSRKNYFGLISDLSSEFNLISKELLSSNPVLFSIILPALSINIRVGILKTPYLFCIELSRSCICDQSIFFDIHVFLE